MRTLLAALVLFSSLPAAGKGLLVSPSSLALVAPPGAAVEETLVLTPATAERTRVTASVEAFALDADGQPWRGAGSASTRSAPSLLEIQPRAFVLESGKPATLIARFSPALSASGSYWAAVVLEVEPVETVGAGDWPIDVIARLVVPVFITVDGGAPPRLAVESLAAKEAGDGAVDVVATVENTGSVLVKTLALVSLEEWGQDGPVEVATGRVTGLTLLPGFPRRIRATLKAPRRAERALVARVLVPYGERLAESEDVVRPRGGVTPALNPYAR